MSEEREDDRPRRKSGKSCRELRDMLAATGTGQDKLRILDQCVEQAERDRKPAPDAEAGIQALKDYPAPEGTIQKAEQLLKGAPVEQFTGTPPPASPDANRADMVGALKEFAAAVLSTARSPEEIRRMETPSEKAEEEGEKKPLAGPPSATPTPPPKPGESARGDFAKNTREQQESKGDPPLPGPGESRKPGDPRPPHKPVGGR